MQQETALDSSTPPDLESGQPAAGLSWAPGHQHPAHPSHARTPGLDDTERHITAPVLAASAGIRKAMLIPVISALAIGTIFVAVYLAAFHAPSARHEPLGIAAPDTVAAKTELSLNNMAPSAFTFYRYADEAAARQAIAHDEVPAVLLDDSSGMRLLVAGAQGPSTVSALTGAVTGAVGHQVPVEDVLPLASGDARGLSVFYAAFGVVLAGFLFAMASYQMAPRLPLTARMISMAVFAIMSGVLIALIAHTGFGAIPASFGMVALLVGLLAWAAAAGTGVLLRIFGPLGVSVASIVMLILGNATSGGILPATFLPGWLSPLAQILPPAAAVRGLRGAAYFHDADLANALLTLATWVVGCLALQYVLDRVSGRRQARVPAPVL
ncbi:ABC transporter permease [Actinospica sp.]|jgi:hypothetical protein|uniref:ABC transporter permease n=1 Tax=Actinospica sp. TaxID=1872142 RepID=UPI002BB61912|nr:ABC transporter permease [Actinospica sp.]HWG25554.1 ABC transporter permease [Actinospica sp.]